MNAAVSTAATTRSPGKTSAAGWFLFVVTVLGVVAIAHHPSVPSDDLAVTIKRIAAASWLSGVVHGVLMALMLMTVHCLSVFAQWRGLSRPSIRAGFIAYVAGVVVMLGAALVSGFVVTDVASLMPHDTPADLQIARALLILCGILNQACADFGVVAMSTGIVFWSLDPLRERGMPRIIGVLGCVVGVVPIIALLAGRAHLDVHGISDVVFLQATWNLAIAAWMIRVGR